MDVFYFGGRHRSAPQKGASDLKWRRQPSAKRRRVCSTMDTSSYYAGVVRIAEPALASNESSLTSFHFDTLLNAGCWPSSLVQSPTEVEQQISERLPTPKSDDRPHDTVRSTVGDGSASRAGRATARPSHPRPVSSDLAEEEDGRRIRFALTGTSDDHVERLRYSDIERSEFDRISGSALEHVASSTRAEDPDPAHDTHSIGSTASNSSLHFDLGPLGDYDIIPPPSAPLFSLQTASQTLWDDNFLAVDDHRRGYDFADFMDRWRLKTRGGAAVTPLKTAIGPPPWRSPLRGHVRRDSGTADGRDKRDLQGLDWQSFEVDRESALEARSLLHPQGAAASHQKNDRTGGDEGLLYTPKAFAPVHQASFSHYQLRNMSAIGDGRKVYYAIGSQVNMASLSCPSIKRTVMDLAKRSHSATPLKVTCLATSPSNERQDDVLIAGGFNGEYAILDLDAATSTKPVEGVVSHARDGIVNHIRTFYGRPSGSLQAAFCSNDQRIRIMDISRQQFTNTFDYKSAINCSAMSADGRLRALVHDSTDTWITNAETGEILVKLEAHTDHAFACD